MSEQSNREDAHRYFQMCSKLWSAIGGRLAVTKEEHGLDCAEILIERHHQALRELEQLKHDKNADRAEKDPLPYCIITIDDAEQNFFEFEGNAQFRAANLLAAACPFILLAWSKSHSKYVHVPSTWLSPKAQQLGQL